jgi:ABC-type nitrate/sulfonate/bicarbonate transport system substrate-binding protein
LRNFSGALVAYCSIVAFSTPSYPASNAAAKTKTTIVYRPDGPVSLSEAGIIVAMKNGYFSDVGLEVRIEEGTSQDQPTADGSITIGTANVFDFFRARAAGQRIVAFASACIRNPITFYARRDSNIRSIADFAGKNVAYDAGHPTAIVFDALLARNHFSKSSIREISGSRMISALVTGKIDILPGEVGRESLALSELGQLFDQINPAAFGLHLPGSVYFTSENALRDNSDALREFLRAVILGWNTVYQKSDEDLRVVADALKVTNADAIKLMLDQQRPLLRPSGVRFSELDPVYLNSALSILVQQRLIAKPPRLADAVNFEIVKEVYRSELGRSFPN